MRIRKLTDAAVYHQANHNNGASLAHKGAHFGILKAGSGVLQG